jgi:hypothetical protein
MQWISTGYLIFSAMTLQRTFLAETLFPISAHAITPQPTTVDESLYDIGRAYHSYVYSGSNQVPNTNGNSTVIISVSSRYYYGQGFGRESVRVWGRLDTINALSPTLYNTISKAWTRFNSSNGTFMITGSNPGYNLSPWVYDVMSWASIQNIGLPLETVKAYIGNMSLTGTERVENSGGNWSIYFHGVDQNIVNLPNTIKYTDSDKAVNQKYSGARTKYNYSLAEQYKTLQ